jgi:hypothetical protein
MIQANELRIGNLLFDAVKIQIEVCALGKDVLMAKDSGTSRYEVVRGIPLTKEWLLRCGFVNEKHGFWWINENFVLGFLTTDDNFQAEYCFAGIGKWTVLDLKFVHQLQNLYFALTGTELSLTKSE